MGICNEGTKSVYQAVQTGRIEFLASVSQEGLTRETQLSLSVQTLRIPVICKAHASLRGKLSCENSSGFTCLSLHTLSL